MKQVTITPKGLSLTELAEIFYNDTQLAVSAQLQTQVKTAHQTLKDMIATGETIYGVNTGFGLLANTRIEKNELITLQRHLLLSHATGVGKLLTDDIVRLTLALKIICLAQGCSGVRWELVEALLQLYNHQVYPCIPEKGSVGASGDLAPLSHLACVLIGEGKVRVKGEILSAKQGLAIAKLTPLQLAPKEGIALVNGTQVSTALALAGLFAAEKCFNAALLAGSLSFMAANGQPLCFDERIHRVRNQAGQQFVAQKLRELLDGYQQEQTATAKPCIQDPYSLRCQPQVMGACYDHMQYVKSILQREVHAVTDNPLVFAADKVVISGGNFHAQPVAMSADTLALAIAEIGSIAERRIALLNDTNFSGLPPFLINDNGINSGFMNMQVTAAALASENKSLAHPASVDSLPTSANQEDHVSMATYAARRLQAMNENTQNIIAIELLAACQGLDLRQSTPSSAQLQKAYSLVREKVSFYKEDHFFADDIAAIAALIDSGKLAL